MYKGGPMSSNNTNKEENHSSSSSSVLSTVQASTSQTIVKTENVKAVNVVKDLSSSTAQPNISKMKRPSTSVLTSDKLAKSSKLSDEMLSFTGNAKQEVCVVCVESPENEKDLANEQSQSQGLSFEEIINKEQHIQEINIQEQQQQNNGVSNNPVHVVVEQDDDMSTVKNENRIV